MLFQSTKEWSKTAVQTKGTASINVDPSSKQTNQPKLLPTRLAQTRVLKQYNVKNTKQTIHIKNMSARRKTSNDKSILLTKKIISQIARKLSSIEIPITEKPVN